MTQATNTIVPVQAGSQTIDPYRIVQTQTGVTGGLNTVERGTGATSGLTTSFALIGVTGELGIDASTVGDMTVAGIGYVKTNQAGLQIGAPITSDAIGQGVAAITTGNRYVGFLLEQTNVVGQICKILVSPGIL
jgi:hypothetical protein